MDPGSGEKEKLYCYSLAKILPQARGNEKVWMDPHFNNKNKCRGSE